MSTQIRASSPLLPSWGAPVGRRAESHEEAGPRAVDVFERNVVDGLLASRENAGDGGFAPLPTCSLPWLSPPERAPASAVPTATSATACGAGCLVDIGDTKMYCEVHGAGKPILMLNGGFQTADDYRFLADRLTDHRQLILVDHRGRGRTGDGEGEITYPRIADDVVKMLDQLGIEKVSLVGHSEGGCVALELMRKYPERVEAAVLIGTPLEVSDADRRWFAAERVAMREKRFDEVLPVAKAMHDTFVQLSPDPARWPIVVDKIYAGWGQHRTWTPNLLGQLHTPTLVFRTENDPFIPTDMFDRAARFILGARCRSIPEGKHNLPMTHPDEVAAAISGFLDEMLPATAKS